MGIFNNQLTIKAINDTLSNEISRNLLIGDILLDKEEFEYIANKVGAFYEHEANRALFLEYQETIAVFLVYCAVYGYDQRAFWGSVEKYVGIISISHRRQLYHIFLTVLDRYGLNKFEHESEEGYSQVTPILCHAGIPVNALESYFVSVSNTIDDSFYDEFSLEDYLAYFKNKTEVTVKRYLRYGSNRDTFNFIQATKKLISYGTVDNEEIMNGNMKRMIEEVLVWREKPKIKKSLQARRNIQLVAPKIRLDMYGAGVVCEFPRVGIRDCYDSFVSWEVISDVTNFNVKAEIYRRNGAFITEERRLSLKPSDSYLISLIVDGEIISKWEFPGVRNDYIAFLPNGTLIKSDNIPDSDVILMLKNNCKIQNIAFPIEELSCVPGWEEYFIYRIDLSGVSELVCTNNNIIGVRADTRPVLEGGSILFDQENSFIYTRLPSTKFPIYSEGEWHIEVIYKNDKEIFKKNAYECNSSESFFVLASYIHNNEYGRYEVKLWHRIGGNIKLAFDYVPNCELIKSDFGYWPDYRKGYTVNELSILASKEVEIDCYNSINHTYTDQKNGVFHKFQFTMGESCFFGEYVYERLGRYLKVEVKKHIHPIEWGFIGMGNQIIEMKSRVNSFTLKELNQSPDPILLFGFDIRRDYNVKYLKIKLLHRNKEIVYQEEYIIENKPALRVPINSFIGSIKQDDLIDYQLCLSLHNSCDDKITEFLVARIQDEVVVNDIVKNEDERKVYLTWSEQGTMIGRECVLVNFTRPWNKRIHIEIEDGKCELIIEKDKMETGIYKYVIQKEKEDLFGESEENICEMYNFQRGPIQIVQENIGETKLQKCLSALMNTHFMKVEARMPRLERISKSISEITIESAEDVASISNAFIIFDRFYHQSTEKEYAKELFNQLFSKIYLKSRIAIEYVLNSNFTRETKKILLHKFGCINVIKPSSIPTSLKRKIVEIDNDLFGFLSVIEEPEDEAGLNWIGMTSINDLYRQDLFVNEEDTESFIAERNMGNCEYLFRYFQYVSEAMLRPKNTTKSSEEFLREYLREVEVDETYIYGKSRLQLVVEWINKTKDHRDVKERLRKITSVSIDRTLVREYSDIFKIINKRNEFNDELGYYIGLVALCGAFVRNGLMNASLELIDVLNFAITKCEKVYYRDAVLIELYMRVERGLIWV
jgi:hypothetical protein